MAVLAQTVPVLAESQARLVRVLKNPPMRSSGGGVGGSGQVAFSDPTLAAVEALDSAAGRKDLVAYDDALGRVVAALLDMRRIEHRWLGPPQRPQRPAMGAPECELARRAGVHEPLFRRTDVAGRLQRQYSLGRWAYRFIESNLAADDPQPLPSLEEIQAHVAGKRVRRHSRPSIDSVSTKERR